MRNKKVTKETEKFCEKATKLQQKLDDLYGTWVMILLVAQSMGKVPKRSQIETPKEYKLKRRRDNASRKPRYGAKKPKYKEKRK